MHFRVCMLGFGHVGRALAQLLRRKQDVLRDTYNLTLSVTGIATHSHGLAIDPDGIDLGAALACVEEAGSLHSLHRGEPLLDTRALLARCPADLVMEATWLDPRSGQPAIDYVRTALEQGCHVVTANKGPVAYAFRELEALARRKQVGFFFESTVMDGAPVLGIGREALLATRIHRIRGILNSTTNFILTRLEQGASFEDAVAEAQAIGVAEADPSTDLEGWDAAVKIVVLANVLMGADLRPSDVVRTGITQVTPDDVRQALARGERIKLVCEAVRDGDAVQARVQPLSLPLSDPLSHIDRTSSAVSFQTDTLHELTLVEGDTDPTTTAYGMLVDMINIARGRYHS